MLYLWWGYFHKWFLANNIDYVDKFDVSSLQKLWTWILHTTWIQIQHVKLCIWVSSSGSIKQLPLLSNFSPRRLSKWVKIYFFMYYTDIFFQKLLYWTTLNFLRCHICQRKEYLHASLMVCIVLTRYSTECPALNIQRY